MPDNNYVWIVMEDEVSFPIAVFQKRYHLVSWMDDPSNKANKHFYTILRFRPYDHEEYKIIDNDTLRAAKNG
jgi:hypothetical protein